MMIYVIDTGYAGQHTDVVIKSGDDVIGHGTTMIDYIKDYNRKANITSVQISNLTPSTDELIKIIEDLIDCVTADDIVLFTWIIEKDHRFDLVVSRLVARCTVVCAAGNLTAPVAAYSPCTVLGIHTITALNKSGTRAHFSNYGPGTIPMFGTNITSSSGQQYTGTSVAAAIYTALLSRNSSPRFQRRAFSLLSRKFANELR